MNQEGKRKGEQKQFTNLAKPLRHVNGFTFFLTSPGG
jgi:hypothetical protein